MKHLLFALVSFFMLTNIIHGQTYADKLIAGKVVGAFDNKEDISIVNINNNEAIVADKDGVFSIHGRAGDILVFSGVGVELKKKMILPEDVRTEQFEISLVGSKNMLKEVVIRNDINAVSLGIVEKEVKQPTTAERRLKTGTKGLMSIDPMLNYITGRTKNLKKDVQTEKKREFIDEVEYLFDEKFYTKTLEIPIDYIDGFKYFCLDDEVFRNYLDTENKAKVKFRIIDLAKDYKKRIK